MIIKDKRYQMVKANPIYGMNDLMKEYLNFIINKIMWLLILSVITFIMIVFPYLNPLEISLRMFLKLLLEIIYDFQNADFKQNFLDFIFEPNIPKHLIPEG